MNLYAYCLNNPVMYYDPNGNFAFFLLTALIGLGIGAAVGTGIGLSNGHTGWQLVGDIALGGLIGGVAGLLVGATISGALTGSFFSSIGTVVNGAKMMYGMYKATGIAGAGYMALDNLKNSFHYTPHVFWSGGDVAMNGGKYFAGEINGVTLEMTRLGQYLETSKRSYEAWRIASANFANQVPNGSVAFAMQNIGGISMTSTWALTEYPILVKKGIEIVFEMLGGI